MSELEVERRVYAEHIEEWRQIHLGEYVLIKGEEVIGFFPDLTKAFDRGTALYGLKPFFVQEVSPAAHVNISFYGARLLAR